MSGYSYIDTSDEADGGNFDQIYDLNHKFEDFKEFSGMIKDLTDFRRQAREVTFRYNMASATMNGLNAELLTIDTIKSYLPDQGWSEKVDELKKEYMGLSKFDEKNEELKQLKEQKEKIATIATEFKVEVSQSGLCCLCYEKPIGVFLDPCGHVCCDECFKNIRGIVCPCCRSNFTKKKIYLL